MYTSKFSINISAEIIFQYCKRLDADILVVFLDIFFSSHYYRDCLDSARSFEAYITAVLIHFGLMNTILHQRYTNQIYAVFILFYFILLYSIVNILAGNYPLVEKIRKNSKTIAIICFTNQNCIYTYIYVFYI